MNVSTQAGSERAWVEVDLTHLIANARTVQAAAGGVPLLPMVKARGYGLGIRVTTALERLAPWGYGVATVDEAVELRDAGIRRPILVFTPAVPPQLPAYRDHDLRAVLDDVAVVAEWRGPFHLEIDTGMGRCGVRWDDARLASVSSEHLEGAFTHFFAADARPETVAMQWSRFERALAALPQRPRLVHAGNSAGAWRLRRRLDMVRPGIFLYGGQAGPDLPAPLPVASLRARVVSLRAIPQGESVSYAGEWTAQQNTTIATLGIGYADGVHRAVQHRAHVLLHGKRVPVVGRVTMDFVMVDLGPGPASVEVGDTATLIGRDGTEEVTLDDFAVWAATISYEVLTGLGPRVRREYVGG